MLAAVAALVTGCWRNEGQPTVPKAESVTVAMPSGLRGRLVLLAGEKRYFDAAHGAWELYRAHWQQAGGSISIIEFENDPPDRSSRTTLT